MILKTSVAEAIVSNGQREPRESVRLCLVVQYPIHNHLPLHQALAHEADIKLEVLFMQENPGYEAEFSRKVDWGLNLREGYTSHTFSNASPWRNSEGFWKWVNPGLIRRVAKGSYDAVCVHGHNNFTHLAAIVAARLTGKRTIIRADTYNLGSRSLLKRLARRLVYTLTFRLAHTLLYVGELNRRCFEDFGGRPEQLVHAPQVVDNARFAGEWACYAPRCGSLKLAFGIAPRQKVCIFCGKFLAKKQPLVLLEAFLDANLGDQWVLLMVGDGPLRAPCEARAAERGATSRVVFAGFLDQKEIGRAFATADILVLPSKTKEPWGLVVNEAMNFRCAIIVSDIVGCAPDLVAGKCGLVFPHDSPDALVDALKRMAGDDELRSVFAERAQAVIAQWSVPAYVSGLRRGLGLPDCGDQ